jgi:hypothetical protein
MKVAGETTVLGLFQEVKTAAEALRRLLEDVGSDRKDLMVLSSVPFPEGVLDVDRSPIRLPIVTLVFALVGVGLGVLVAGGSAALYVLDTGGRPILSGPPIGIIAYEIMMVVALTATFFAALYELRLPSWRARVYDSRIAEGMIGIAVHCRSEDAAGEAEALLVNTGAEIVRRDARNFE